MLFKPNITRSYKISKSSLNSEIEKIKNDKDFLVVVNTKDFIFILTRKIRRLCKYHILICKGNYDIDSIRVNNEYYTDSDKHPHISYSGKVCYGVELSYLISDCLETSRYYYIAKGIIKLLESYDDEDNYICLDDFKEEIRYGKKYIGKIRCR